MQEVSVAEKGINITPAWVPGKFELAAALSFSGDQEIYLLTGSGKIIKRLTRMQWQRYISQLVTGRQKDCICFHSVGKSPDIHQGSGLGKG